MIFRGQTPLRPAVPVRVPPRYLAVTSLAAKRWRLVVRADQRARGALAPVLATVFALIVTSVGYLRARHFPWPYGFADIGAKFARHIGLQGLAVSEIGYDGQFSYYMAVHPRLIVSCATDASSCPLDVPLLRSERILYPLVARLLAFNQPDGIAYALFFIDFVAILVTVFLLSRLCAEVDTSRWLALAGGLFWGETLGLVQDVSEPFAVMWLVLAVWCVRRNHPRWAAAALAAAVLSREQLFLFVPLLALPLLVRRRWAMLASCAAIALAPFFAWQIVLKAIYGEWAFTASSMSATLVSFPFEGLWQARAEPQWSAIVLFIVVPIFIALLIAGVSLLRQRLRGLLDDPIPLFVLCYCVALSFTWVYQWHEIFSPSRLAAPAVVLAALAAQYAPRPMRTVYASYLLVSAVVLMSAYLLPTL
jgi:hypothetical protein